ncbi:hypothetical protein [Anaerosalibacter sp. Marseille-P3206]|uniref:hypothetical protein n=1 Tax=Anaerosalibacter sp. Marseille-P3206 TaxID=1871005 RepID=UPI00135640ED|nr:hypothetical protein [Anaerosalibacter sp. Marseille-P3206]
MRRVEYSPRKMGSIDDDILLDKKGFGISATPLDNKKNHPIYKIIRILLPFP